MPFWLPLSVWISMYTWGKLNNIHFHEWLLMQNMHNLSAVFMGLVSLYVDDDDIFNERILIMFNLSYFLLDFVDCVKRKDVAFTAHAFFCITLGLCNYGTPTFRALRMNSKACLFEVSSPFLHVSKHTRNPMHFLLFILVFTACRIVWMPVLSAQLYYQGGVSLTDFRQVLLCGFYALNCYWYYKMIRIIVKKTPSSKQEV